MKKKLKTYCVPGMMEYLAVIKIGSATLRVMFSDGSSTAMGQNPARYTTKDLAIQLAIENSANFRKGRIKLERTIELDEDVEIESSRNNAVTEVAGEGVSVHEAGDAVAPVEDEKTKIVEVEFVCNDDAKDYLENTFGALRSKLRSRADIIAYGESVGVKISFVQ